MHSGTFASCSIVSGWTSWWQSVQFHEWVTESATVDTVTTAVSAAVDSYLTCTSTDTPSLTAVVTVLAVAVADSLMKLNKKQTVVSWFTHWRWYTRRRFLDRSSWLYSTNQQVLHGCALDEPTNRLFWEHRIWCLAWLKLIPHSNYNIRKLNI